MLDRLAAPAMLMGDHERARALADQSLALFREIGDRAGSLYPLSKVAWDEWSRGNRARGVALTEEALALARETGDSWWAAGLLSALAEKAWEQGDLARSAVLSRESVSLGHELGNAHTLVYGFGLLAGLAAEAGDQERAGLLWGAVDALEESGEFLDAESRALYERPVLALSGAEFETARAEGRAMTLDEAVELALSE